MVFDRSNGIYRGFVTAFAGLILIGAGGKPAPRADTKQAQAAQPVASKSDNTNPATPKTDESESKDQGCKQGQDDRQSDLCAQWKAADAATDAARSSDTQTFIGWIGLLLGGITMGAAIAAALYARRAAVATESTVGIAQDAADGASEALTIANRNADAAAKLVEVSQRNAERQLRAYVVITDASFAMRRNSVALGIVNAGQTPAYDFSAIGVVRFADSPPTDLTFDMDVLTRGILGPKSPFHIEVAYDEETAKGPQGALMHVIGEIRYTDIFHQRWVQRFCLTQSGPFEAGRLGSSIGGNSEKRLNP